MKPFMQAGFSAHAHAADPERGKTKKDRNMGQKDKGRRRREEYFEVLQSAHAADSFKLEPAV